MRSSTSFFFALTVAIITLSGISLLWPRLTTNPRPEILQRIHDILLSTPVGQQSAQVLGVSDEADIVPLDAGQIATGAIETVKQNVRNRIQAVVVGNAVNSLSQRFDQLPEQQKEQIQQIFCKPAE